MGGHNPLQGPLPSYPLSHPSVSPGQPSPAPKGHVVTTPLYTATNLPSFPAGRWWKQNGSAGCSLPRGQSSLRPCSSVTTGPLERPFQADKAWGCEDDPSRPGCGTAVVFCLFRQLLPEAQEPWEPHLPCTPSSGADGGTRDSRKDF